MWGAERADVQHRRHQDRAGPRGRWCSRSTTLPDGKSNKGRVQAYRRADLRRRRGPLPDDPPSPTSASRSPYELTEDQYKAALDLLRHPARASSRRYWHDAMHPGRRLHQRGRRRLQRPGPSMVNLLKGQNTAGRLGRSPSERRHRLGGHHHDGTPTPRNPNCAYMWIEHSAFSPNLQADLVRLVRRGPGRAGRLHAQRSRHGRRRMAARPTASTTSTRSASGRTPAWRSAPRRPPDACPTIAG
jgi:putative spermidine/putrescine transport system substrate-binding protein